MTRNDAAPTVPRGKERRERFRDAARRLYARDGFDVPLHADVHPVEGGAFVEAVVWVPERWATSDEAAS